MYLYRLCILKMMLSVFMLFFFFQAEDGIRDRNVTGVQTCALPILLRETKVLPHARTGGLHNKNRSDGQENHRTVEIKRITGRHNETDDAFRHAKPFHRLHRFGHGRFATRGRESDCRRFADGAHKLPNRRTDYYHDESENEHDENCQSQVITEYELPQTNKHTRTLGANGML